MSVMIRDDELLDHYELAVDALNDLNTINIWANQFDVNMFNGFIADAYCKLNRSNILRGFNLTITNIKTHYTQSLRYNNAQSAAICNILSEFQILPINIKDIVLEYMYHM